VLFVYVNLHQRIFLLTYSLIVLTTVVLYLMACDPLPPCAGRLTVWLRGAAPSQVPLDSRPSSARSGPARSFVREGPRRTGSRMARHTGRSDYRAARRVGERHASLFHVGRSQPPPNLTTMPIPSRVLSSIMS
jgi:hypothetical protein